MDKEFWLGLMRDDTGTWKWDDGGTAVWTHWGRDEPAEEEAGVIDPGGWWKTEQILYPTTTMDVTTTVEETTPIETI